MNQSTQDIIQFLTHPDLDFAADSTDLAYLDDPELLQQRVAELLNQPSPFLQDHAVSQELKSRLHEVDWPLVAGEFKERVNAAAHFFDGDARTHQSAGEIP